MQFGVRENLFIVKLDFLIFRRKKLYCGNVLLTFKVIVTDKYLNPSYILTNYDKIFG